MANPTSDISDIVIGDEFDVQVGPPAHGGHCVARIPGQGGGIVVFVRHALPGEQVIARITETHKGYLRADATRIISASPDRVAPPCPYAHPDGCGGCDLQHVAPPAQRDWKAAVVREQLLRLAGLSEAEVDILGVRVESVGADEGSAGWRTRVRYRVDAAGRAGLLKHRSNEVVAIDRCRIAHPAVQQLDVLARQWPDRDVIDVLAPSAGPAIIVGDPPQQITEQVRGRRFELSAAGFWQVHPAAAQTLTDAVLEMVQPRRGERAWDLYGGAGVFAAALAAAGCSVTLVEADPASVAAARRSLADLPVRVVGKRVEHALHQLRPPVDLVVLDPPRSGAGVKVVRQVAAARPRAVAYVACDPAALARDVRTFRELGWRLTGVQAFDCFPFTHHVETVAILCANS